MRDKEHKKMMKGEHMMDIPKAGKKPKFKAAKKKK